MEISSERNAIAIVVAGSGKSVRLGSPAKWRRAIELGDLLPETPVEVLAGGVTTACLAGEVAELQPLFAEMGLRTQPVQAADEPAPEQAAPEQAAPEQAGPEQAADNAAPPVLAEAGPPADAAPPQDTYPPLPADALESPESEAQSATGGMRSGGGTGGNRTVIIITALAALAALGLSIIKFASMGRPVQPLPAPPPAAAAASGEMLELGRVLSWDSSTDPGPKIYQFGDLTLTLSSRSAGGGLTQPVLTIATAQGASVEILGVARNGQAMADLGVVQAQGGGAPPQIYFSSYTGGAHCCTEGKLILRSGETFSTLGLGDWDQGIRFQDLDGDGVSEILVSDERFLYAFAPYAGSVAPPKILQYRNGAVSDVSTAPVFQAQFIDAMNRDRDACLQRSNGACAAFVAEAARAGQLQPAWDAMLSHYDPADSWDYPTGCSVDAGGGTCPAGSEIRYPSFPAALQAFLIANGYIQAGAVAAPDAAPDIANQPPPSAEPSSQPSAAAVEVSATAPSFDCSRVTSVNLRLICSTPQLAEADNRLAAAYARPGQKHRPGRPQARPAGLDSGPQQRAG